MGHVFVSPLSWGLGHATRDIPLIQELLTRGHEVTVGSSGNALALLQKECPECNFLLFKDCLLYTSDAADDLLCVDLGGRRIIKKKKHETSKRQP